MINFHTFSFYFEHQIGFDQQSLICIVIYILNWLTLMILNFVANNRLLLLSSLIY
jgi:hypothetical protein